MFFLISYATAIRGVDLALVMRLGRYVHASHLPAPEISVRRSMIQEEAEHSAALGQTRDALVCCLRRAGLRGFLVEVNNHDNPYTDSSVNEHKG